MAFNTNAAAAPVANNDSWKAQGFLNLYLPSKNGERRKLGAIPLKESKPNEKALLEWLNEDPSRVLKIMEKLVIEYQSAVPAEGNGFDLD
jgi:hypothetical protein